MYNPLGDFCQWRNFNEWFASFVCHYAVRRILRFCILCICVLSKSEIGGKELMGIEKGTRVFNKMLANGPFVDSTKARFYDVQCISYRVYSDKQDCIIVKKKGPLFSPIIFTSYIGHSCRRERRFSTVLPNVCSCIIWYWHVIRSPRTK